MQSMSQEKDPVLSAFLKEVEVPLIQRFKDYLTAEEKFEHKAFGILNMLSKQYAVRDRLLWKTNEIRLPKTPPRDKKEESEISALITSMENSSHQRQLVLVSLAYFYGIGVLEDRKKSRQYAYRAIELGNADAHYIIGELYHYTHFHNNDMLDGNKNISSYKKMQFHLEQAVAGGNTCSHMELSILYSAFGGENGKTKAQEILAKGRELQDCFAFARSGQHKEAAMQGYAESLRNLYERDTNFKIKDVAKYALYFRLSSLYQYTNVLDFHLLESSLQEKPNAYVSYHGAMAFHDVTMLERAFIADPKVVLKLFVEDMENIHALRAQQVLEVLKKISPSFRIKLALYFCAEQYEKSLILINDISPAEIPDAENNLDIATYLYAIKGADIAYPFLMSSIRLGNPLAERMLSNIVREKNGMFGLEEKPQEFTDAEKRCDSFSNFLELRNNRNHFFHRTNDVEMENASTPLPQKGLG